MPIHMGIMCDACRTVYFVATWPGITPSERDKEIFTVACKRPCPEAKEARTDVMRPYRVSERAFSKGYAREGEYEIVPAKLSSGDRPKGRKHH